ncbi:hypothetical protein BDP27DRAFT_1433561 [Rhodocollybia butyracea]|uniref:BZIP domain-containing protein n=1 Tax=Rhodocollybia butyracea TaxID=206335 RepID=A0A9P5P7F4_9AGAR|nr:hypothetical protein BDP27DRAFT_1433561 [Rhodocollybia butyracea]
MKPVARKGRDFERVRENQRRSRERKREYVASLEARLAEYSKNGVQANIELQSKARAVLEENKALRKLLAGPHWRKQYHVVAHLPDRSRTTDDLDGPASLPSTAVLPSSPSCFDPLLAQNNTCTSPPVTSPPSAPLFSDVPSSAADFLVCDITNLSPPTSEELMTRSFTSCRVAFNLLESMNQSRASKLNLLDFAIQWLQPGFRAPLHESECCVVDNEVLSQAVQRLLTE